MESNIAFHNKFFRYRNEQKKCKRARHEREKDYLSQLERLGNVVGEYVGDGQGEDSGSVVQEVDFDAVDDDFGVVYADLEVDDLSMEQSEDSSDEAQPLLFLYDCETTGFSIYNEQIIEIAAEIVDCPVSYASNNFSSLVKTSRRIPAAGIKSYNTMLFFIYGCISHKDYQHLSHHDSWGEALFGSVSTVHWMAHHCDFRDQ